MTLDNRHFPLECIGVNSCRMINFILEDKINSLFIFLLKKQQAAFLIEKQLLFL